MQCSQGPFCSLRNLKPLIAFALLHKQRPASLLKALPHLDKALAASYCQGVLYLAFCHGKYRNMVFSLLFPNLACSATGRDIHWFSVVSSLLPIRLIPFCVDQNSTAKQCSRVVHHRASPKACSNIMLAQHISRLYIEASAGKQTCVHPCSKHEQLKPIKSFLSKDLEADGKELDIVLSVYKTSHLLSSL